MVTLPTVGSDNNTWGTELNNYLQVSHSATGLPLGRVAGSAGAETPNIWIKVQDYGPVAQNGDITAALQAAFTALRSAGAATQAFAGLELPAGSYTITTSINGTGLGNVGGIEIKSSGPGACHLTINLAAAFPGLDFTGSARVRFRDVYITGNAAGSQTCAILGARAQSNTTGDDARYSGLLIDGTFSQCVVALISCDLASIRDSELLSTGAPVGIYVGTTDLLTVGSAYQTFASVTGNTIFTADHVAVGANARSGFLFQGGVQYNLRSCYAALFGTAAHAVELVGTGSQAVWGDIRVETPTSTAASQDVLYVNGTAGSSRGMLTGAWNFNAPTDAAMVRFGTNTPLTNYIINGTLANAGAGTKKVFAGTGTPSLCIIWNHGRLTSDSAPTASLVVGAGGSDNNWQMPTIVIPDSGILNIQTAASSDGSVQVKGDGQSGDGFFKAWRGAGTTEAVELLAAAGGSSGLNNLLALVLQNNGTVRDFNVYDYNGSSFTRIGGFSATGRHPRFSEASNNAMGTVTLAAGTATVSNTSITTSSRIFLTSQVDGGTPGWLRVSARSANTSFTVTSSSNTDTSTVAYLICEPA